jgi:hypothetical protein
MTTLMEAYQEIGAYLGSKIDHTTPYVLAADIAQCLEEQFQDFHLQLKVERKDDGVAVTMAINPDYILPFLQEIRRIKMEVTSLQNSWGSP